MKEKKKYRPRNCSSLAASVMIQDYHQERLEKYAQVKQISLQKAVDVIIQLHIRGVNVAQHMSEAIGIKHEKYQDTLRKLGENTEYIR
jgi:hypothetical protein